MDWRKILLAYIDHVIDCEGTDFLRTMIESGSTPDLTDEEIAALRKAAEDAWNARA